MQKHLITAASLACLGIVAVSVVSYCGGKFVMDDALMFVRYANNWLATGTVDWNPGDRVAYGPSLLGYLSEVNLLSALINARLYIGPNRQLEFGGFVSRIVRAYGGVGVGCTFPAAYVSGCCGLFFPIGRPSSPRSL